MGQLPAALAALAAAADQDYAAGRGPGASVHRCAALLCPCCLSADGASSPLPATNPPDRQSLPPHPCRSMALLVRWLLLCAGKLCENAPEVTAMALREQVRAGLAGSAVHATGTPAALSGPAAPAPCCTLLSEQYPC